MVREKSLQLILGVVPRLQMQVLRTLVVIYITLFCKRRPFHPEATEMTSFYLPPVGDNASIKSVSGICAATAPAAEEPLMLKTPGDTGQAIPSPTSHSQRPVKGETASSTKRHFCSSPFWLTQETRAQLPGEVFATAKGRQGRERRGRRLPVAGKAGSSMQETFTV